MLDTDFLKFAFGEKCLTAFQIIKRHMHEAWKIFHVEMGQVTSIEGLSGIHALDEYGDVIDELERGFGKAVEELGAGSKDLLRSAIEAHIL